MKKLSLIPSLLLVAGSIAGQKVGIGTSDPQAKFHVAGTTRTDSLLLKPNSGTSVLGEFNVSQVLLMLEQNNGDAAWGASADGWQSFTATENGVLKFVEMYFLASQPLSQLIIYEGEGTSGAQLQSVSMSNVTGSNTWVSSPELNVVLSQNTVYTLWLDNIQHWMWASGNPYPGGKCTINPFVDFKFKVKTSLTKTPFKVEGAGTAEFNMPNEGSVLNVNGEVIAQEIKITQGAAVGHILTSDASGQGSWMPPPQANSYWTESSGNIYNSNAGNVGIGISNPTAKLMLAGTGTLLRIGAPSGSHGNTTLFSFAGDGAFSIDAPNIPGGRLLIHGTSGFIGIGNPSPAERLDVTGNIKLSGTLINEAQIDAAFQSNWSNGQEAYIGGPVRYYKDKEKRVHLSGGAERHVSAGDTIFILPAGYRPADSVYFNAAGGPDLQYRVVVNPDGSVQSLGNNQLWVSLDNISFRVN